MQKAATTVISDGIQPNIFQYIRNCYAIFHGFKEGIVDHKLQSKLIILNNQIPYTAVKSIDIWFNWFHSLGREKLLATKITILCYKQYIVNIKKSFRMEFRRS